MDKPIYLGFSILELSKLYMCQTYYDTIHPYFGHDKLQLHHMNCDSFVLSIETENNIQDLRNLEDIFDFRNLEENHELFSNKNNKVIGKFKIETLKSFWIDKFIALRSKCYAFECGDDSKSKLKGISKSQTKNIKFVEYEICLDEEENVNECDNFVSKSYNHDMYLQKIRKTTLSIFDDKRNFLDNIKSLPWN